MENRGAAVFLGENGQRREKEEIFHFAKFANVSNRFHPLEAM
jgi:hypothetical protein